MTIEITNQTQAEEVLNAYLTLQERAEDVASQILELRHPGNNEIAIEHVTPDHGGFDAHWEEWGRCNYHDEGSFWIPMSYLFDDSWIELEKARIKAEAEEKARLEQERADRAKQRQEELERKKFEELKAKFEGGVS